MPRKSKQRRDPAEDFRFLVAARIEEGELSVRKVAKDSGIAYTYLYRILNGRQVPTLSRAHDIAQTLGIKIKISRG